MSLMEVAAISDELTKAKIKVPTFVSPLLKWPAEGRTGSGGAVDFAFDPALCPAENPIVHALDIATVLGATRLRVFSHLRYADFQPGDLEPTLDRLLDVVGRYDVTVELENEPVCNIGSVAELARLFEVLPDMLYVNDEDELPLRPLVDIANSYVLGAPPEAADIDALAPRVDAIHLKDLDLATGKIVPLGEGSIAWAGELKRLLSGTLEAEVLASIETHCPQDPRNATARSVAALRRLAAEIGVEIV